MLANHEATRTRIPTLVGVAAPVVRVGRPAAPLLVVEATTVTSRSEFWTVIGTRAGRLTRALGKPVSYAEAVAVVKAWSSADNRACFRDEVRMIPAAFDPCSVMADS